MKKLFKKLIVMIVVATAAQAYTEERSETMHKPKLIVFDVNETLLSLDPVKTEVGKALDGREDLLPLWFSTMLHHSLIETLTENYRPFGEIGAASLVMVAETQGMEMEYAEAKDVIITAMRSLPPHADTTPGLTALRQAGKYKMVTLTNSSDSGAKSKLTKAGMIHLFDEVYTVESLKKYKPHPDTYNKVLKATGCKPEDVLFVAAHAWDLVGAKNVGMQTAFIARPGKTLYPLADRPDYVVNTLVELADLLK